MILHVNQRSFLEQLAPGRDCESPWEVNNVTQTEMRRRQERRGEQRRGREVAVEAEVASVVSQACNSEL